MKLSKSIKVLGIALAVSVLASPTAYASIALTGAGATFPGPIIEACKAGYNDKTGNTFTYGLGGSGAGRTASDKQTGIVNFSDTPHLAARAGVIHLPIVAGPIAVMYNIGNSKPLYLSPATVAGIFGGTITKWNDPKIVADNNRSVKEVLYKTDGKGNTVKNKAGQPIVLREVTRKIRYTLPNKPIKVVFRSDTSGTTNNFVRYLGGVAPSVWTKPANDAFTTAFPGNINATTNIGRIVGANGSQGVATLAAKTPYSITYAEKQWGTSFGLRTAYLGNASGNFALPESAAVSAFLGEAKQDAQGIVTYDYDTKVPGAYPLGIVSYMLLETSYKNKEKGKAVVELAEYLLSPECSLGAASTGFIVVEGTFLAKAKQLIARANK